MSDNHVPGSIRVIVPDESSVIVTASGESFVTEIEADGTRVVHLLPDDARRLINSGLPCCMPWREANAQLAANLGVQKVERGVSIAQMQNMAWQSMRPTTVLEDIQRLRAATGAWR